MVSTVRITDLVFGLHRSWEGRINRSILWLCTLTNLWYREFCNNDSVDLKAIAQ